MDRSPIAFNLCRLAPSPGILRAARRYKLSRSLAKSSHSLIDFLVAMVAGERSILLVDDNRGDRILMTQALLDAGLECQIAEASDGEEAELYLLQKLSEDAIPCIVVLDLILPKRSGLEIMERWHAKGFTKLTRIVVLSSLVRAAENVKLQELGAVRVFEKPVDLDAFPELARQLKELAVVSEPLFETVTGAAAG
jgi:CheY-like chemotaxis protein